jgi:hypothetical protein
MTKHPAVPFTAAFALAIPIGDAHAQINAAHPPLMGQKSFHWSVPRGHQWRAHRYLLR